MDANDDSGAPRQPEVSAESYFQLKNLLLTCIMEFVTLSVCFQCNQGKYKAMAICFILGIGSLVSWNSMLTIGDYYYILFPVSNSWCFQFLIGLDIIVQRFFSQE